MTVVQVAVTLHTGTLSHNAAAEFSNHAGSRDGACAYEVV